MLEVREAAPATRERILGEAWSAGTVGIEERGDGSLLIYARLPDAARLRAAVVACGSSVVSATRDVELRPWSEDWKRGLTASSISPRLRIRPPFVDAPLRPGQVEVVVDPGQAFGTGVHPSTQLALAWVDRICESDTRAGRRSSWLDLGTGTGVLGLAALALGAERVLGMDLDPLATRAARACASQNRQTERFEVVCGSLDAIRAHGFDRVVANLLRNELLPLAGAIADRLVADGLLLVSGLLDRDQPVVVACFARLGFALVGRLEQPDADGETWVGLCLERPGRGAREGLGPIGPGRPRSGVAGC